MKLEDAVPSRTAHHRKTSSTSPHFYMKYLAQNQRQEIKSLLSGLGGRGGKVVSYCLLDIVSDLAS